MIAEAVTTAPMPPATSALPIGVTPPVASNALSTPRITVQQYLEMERKSQVRHEYVNGKVIAMAGESPAHNRIAGNIYRQLGNRFEDQPCDVFIEGIRTQVSPTQYRYPDVVALCGEAQFDAAKPPALLNPAVIFEVMSPSTEHEDRDEKWTEYQQLPSVTDYVLVAQDAVLVMHYIRESETHWTITIYRDLQNVLALASLNTSLTLADIYRKIVFPTVEAPAAIAE